MSTLETRLLLHLWRVPVGTVAGLAGLMGSSPERIHQGIAALEAQGCLFDRTPSSVELLRVGLGCWRDILEEGAKGRYSQLGQAVRVYQQTASTNDLALRAAQDGSPAGLVILADEQTGGRGRRGHAWVAKRGQSILFSILLPGPAPAASDDRLTLLAGLAVAEGLEGFGLSTVQIKWPNDVLIGSRKVAGILVEVRNGHVVLGVGINVSQAVEDFPMELRERATSVYLATGQVPDRLRIVEKLLPAIEVYCTQNPPPEKRWLEAWRSRCGMLGKLITATTSAAGGMPQKVTGQVMDIDPLKGLLVRDSTGALVWLSSQTTTLSAG